MIKKYDRRFTITMAGGIAAIVIVGILAVMIGSTDISLGTIADVIFKNGIGSEEYQKAIIKDIRLPRIIMAVLIGMMLASSGVVVQNVFQNPLADPYIIGISASATFGAVLAYILKMPDIMYGVMAFAASVTTSLIIFKIAGMRAKVHTSTLLIIGIAVSSFLAAFTSFAMYMIGEDSFRIVMWTMGYLGHATWLKIIILLIPFLCVQIYFLYRKYDIDILMSGDIEAHSLGINSEKVRVELLTVASLIVAFSVAFSGMIGFVGLIIPHTLRMVVGSSNKKLIPAATVTGGLFLLLCDTFARVVLAPVEVPIGVITSFIGAPFFLVLAFKNRGRR
jgi:iron complex transport system permease protein